MAVALQTYSNGSKVLSGGHGGYDLQHMIA